MSDSTLPPPSPPPDYVPTHTTLPLDISAQHSASPTRTHADLPTEDRSTDPIILTWNPPQPPGPSSSAAPSQQYTPGPALSPNPPEYDQARLPTKPVVYTFSPLGFNSMILVPPPDFPDTRPQYHISVNLNCFMPFSFITTIRHGATEHGDYVGDFEMGISNKSDTLYIRGREFRMSDVLVKNKGSRTAVRIFIPRRVYGAGDFAAEGTLGIAQKCTSIDGQVIYAKFTPPHSLRVPNRPAELAQLEVMPEGQAIFDDILISCLITERWRLTPLRREDIKSLFVH